MRLKEFAHCDDTMYSGQLVYCFTYVPIRYPVRRTELDIPEEQVNVNRAVWQIRMSGVGPSD